VIQVALVALGKHLGLVNNWYFPTEGEKVPADSILFPLSHYLVQLLTTLAQDLSNMGSWVPMPAWWHGLEMRKLRLRHNIKGLYLYDTHTCDGMVLYQSGQVTMHSTFTPSSTIASRLEVWVL